MPSFGTGRKSLAWKNFWKFFSNFLVKSVRKNENFWEKIWLFELDTSKKREKFTDHDGVVRFLKSQKIKSYIYIYREREREISSAMHVVNLAERYFWCQSARYFYFIMTAQSSKFQPNIKILSNLDEALWQNVFQFLAFTCSAS